MPTAPRLKKVFPPSVYKACRRFNNLWLMLLPKALDPLFHKGPGAFSIASYFVVFGVMLCYNLTKSLFLYSLTLLGLYCNIFLCERV